MTTTTLQAIRAQQISVIEALTPTSISGQRFRRTTAVSQPEDQERRMPLLRHFDIVQASEMLSPEVSNADVYDRMSMLDLMVAYPAELGRHGRENFRALEGIVEEDFETIDNAIGLHGAANYVSGQHSCIAQGNQFVREQPVSFLVIRYEVFYRRAA